MPDHPPLLRSAPSALTVALAGAEAQAACRRAELERRAEAGEAMALTQALLRLAEDDLAILRNLERGLLGTPRDEGR